MHHLKFKFTGFLKVFTQYALILRRSVFKDRYGPTAVKINCRLKSFVILVNYCYNNVSVYFNL
jgi:hypothetical protein